MRRKIMAVTVVLAMLALFAGCTRSGGTTILAVENNTSTEMSMSYKYFDGYREKTITLEEGQTLEVLVDIVSEHGILDLSITDGADEVCYRGEELHTSAFVVTLDKPGQYTIRVDAEKHSGSYSLSWAEKQP